jgi:hypothetical protein
VAYAVWEIYRRCGDLDFVREVYDPMVRYYQYLISKRDPRDRHLVGVINPDESGEDDSPRFDAALSVPPDISPSAHLRRRLELIDANKTCNFDAEMCMKRYFWVKDVPFNTFLIENIRILSHMASLLGNNDDVHFCELHADLIQHAMRDYMFEDGVFWPTYGNEYERIRVATWAHFAPLFAGVYTQEEAERLVEEHLYNTKTFRSPHGIRTVSMEELSYRPDGFWRGPIWMAPNWVIFHGLTRYGFSREAADVRDMSASLIERNGFREYFNPESGEGLGAHNFTWGTLVTDMIEV